MRQVPVLSFAMASLLLGLTACGGGGDDRESVGCPAIVLSDGPSLILASVQNAATAASIPVVVLSDITVGGSRVPLELLSQQSLNVRVVGNTLECTLPCGFSASAGEQAFTVSAPGYISQTVSAIGSYAGRRGECPPTLTDGKRISLSLHPS
ncbi:MULTISPECIES: hypothetical protein [unclassified Roseateles]|uniref:hypothetical protein n=1 Tax=unclassified Roseateles TaxID=2626991 RepID=UPI0012E34EAB|nr:MULTISPECIES: hypothetical protein [unclassified Roseateles]